MKIDDALMRFDPQEDGCWLWNAAIADTGYGVVNIAGRVKGAHRLFYEQMRGEIPEGLVIDHLCRTRACVNPYHMEPVTRGENVRRGKRLITQCPQGHKYDEEGGVNKLGHRYCRACARERMRGYR